MSAQMKRFIAALAMVGTLFAVLLGIHVVQGVNKGASTVSSSANEVAEEQKEDHAQNQEPPLSTKWMLDQMSQDESETVLFRAFEQAGGAPVRWGELPAGFADEFFEPGDIDAYQVASLDAGVGLLCGGDPQQQEKRVKALLTEKGWTAIEYPSKETMGSAWVKQGGQWQWAFVSAQQSGKTTCITVLFWRY